MTSRHRPADGALRRAVSLSINISSWVALPALLAGACGPPEPHPTVPRWKLLVVTFDTTRADHIGSYGHQAASTPVVDRLAAEGVLFERAMATVPITLPSHSSLMTGKVPMAHGVRDNGLFVLGDEQVTLAEILRDAGYRTAAAVSSFPLTARFGIDQGFETFDDHLTSPYEDLYGQRVLPKDRFFFDERRAGRANEAILPWLEENSGQPFFLWLHYFDPHHPHEPPAPYDQLFAHELYDGEIAYADESLGVVLEHLRRLGVAEETLIVFTSDHGEGRGEHDESTHSLLAYQSTLRVPLVVKLPEGPRGRRIEQRVSTVDVLPTVLDYLELEPPAGIQGISLRPLIDGHTQAGQSLTEDQSLAGQGPAGEVSRSRRRPLYAETLSPRLSRGWGELRALVVGGKKYIHGPRPELFDLDRDPQELDDLVSDEPELAARMRRQLEAYLGEHAAPDLDSSVALDDEAVRRLQALGYLQGSGERVGAIEERLGADGDAPQDHAASITAFSQARSLLFHGRALAAQGFIRDLLRADPDNPYYLEMLAITEIRVGDGDGALAILRQLEELGGSYPPPERILKLEAEVLLARGEADRAYAKLREAEALEPTAEGQYLLALFYQRAGEARDAKRFFDRALELEPAFVPAHVDRAIHHVVEGDLERAEEHLELALAADPFSARAHYNYGALLVQTDRRELAAARFERAAQLRPNYRLARAALVEVLISLGRIDDAETQAAALERLAPGSEEALHARTLIGSAS